MKFSIKKANPEKQRSACVVVGVFEPRKLTEAAEAIDIVLRLNRVFDRRTFALHEVEVNAHRFERQQQI